MQPIKLYLASHYERLEEIQQYRAHFVRNGYIVTSRWLDSGEKDDALWHDGTYGREDLEDINNSHFLIAFTDETAHVRGGLQHETGYAMALDYERVLLIGPKVNVFHQCIRDEHVFSTVEQCITFLDKLWSLWNPTNKMFPVLRPSNPISMYKIYTDTYLTPQMWMALYENQWTPTEDYNSARRGRDYWRSRATTQRRDNDVSSVYDGKPIT